MEATHPAVAEYKKRLEANAIRVTRVFEATDSTPEVTLVCWEIDYDHKPRGFLCSTTQTDRDKGVVPKYQYRVGQAKMTAWHVPFLGQRRDPSNPELKLTLSHLCHNNACYNPDHHTVESLAVNKGRNGCAGGSKCAHKRAPCLIRGPDIE